MKALLLAVALAGCADVATPTWAPDGGACMAYQAPAGTDLSKPTVSFKTDVMPVLTRSCMSASCHGLADGSQGGLFLGTAASLVGTSSGQLTSMPYVSAGDPTHSYLMHKLDADQCMYGSECINHDCLHAMPFDGQLPVETRDIVRRWIAQGARDN